MTTTSTAADEVRVIDNSDAPTRFARGWHCLGLAENFCDGKPHSIEAFGTKLVVFADRQGALKILDAYCRHMGGDLSQGSIKGDEVACPFHDWRWGGDGRCKRVPYAKRVPLRARTNAWTTLVQDDLLFVWNDPEGAPPTADA
ncbi:MAG: Rieske 2Fe-2S domain-containing protein, partial [Mycobacteriaceae bacterium]